MGGIFSSPESNELNIIVLGEMGAGKSTLINNIFGESVAPARPCAWKITQNVTKYTKVMNGVTVNLFDTPGLADPMRDDEDVIAEIKEKTKEVSIDFIWICINITLRYIFIKDTLIALKYLKPTLSSDAEWNRILIVLTHADMIHGNLKEICSEKERLICKYSIEALRKISCVPTGHYKDHDLPGIGNWVSNIWQTAVTFGKETYFLKVPALIKLHQNQLDSQKRVQEPLPYDEIKGDTCENDISDINDEIEEQEFLKGIDEAIAKSGKIDRKLADIVFVGPTGAGKTSLMNRLLGRLEKILTSTGICEDLVTVDINIPNPTTLQAATMLEDTWKEMECEASFVRQIGLESISTSEKTREAIVAPEPADHQVEIQPLPPVRTVGESTKYKATSEISPSFHEFLLYQEAPQVKPLPAASPVMKKISTHSTIQSVIKEYGFDNFKEYLKKTFTLYLRDTGGQVEFQEMLALLTFGPSIFFFVFRTFLDLQSKFEVKYRTSADESINCYTSSITTEEALLQCLASVYAMDTSGVVKTHEPLVFIVGTHIDKLGSERDARIASLNQHLDFVIKDNGFENIVQYADRDKVMFTVDNSLEKEDNFQLIRSRVNELVIKRDMFNIEYPVNYLLVCLDLQNIKKSILTLDEFSDLAASHGITNNQVPHLLQFLQIRIGLIRYFDVEGLRHIIVKEPQVLFNGATDLVVKTYSSKSLTQAEACDFVHKGIITLSVFKSVATTIDGLSPEIFLKLLVHLRITAPVNKPGDKEERYFLPCVLNHVPESSKEDQQTCVLPLAIKFKCRHCPKGIYGVLVTRLMQLKDNSRNTTFGLLEDKIFKDQVSFQVNSGEDIQDEISLKIFSSHIEIKYFPELSDDRPSPLGEACDNVRQIIDFSISSSLKDLHYDKKKVGPLMCFECEHCEQLHPVEKRNDYHITRCGRKVNRIPPSAEFWYNEGIQKYDETPPRSSTNGQHQPLLPTIQDVDRSTQPHFAKLLDIDDLADVVDVTEPLSSVWRRFSIKLGVGVPKLDAIEANYPRSVESCLCRALEEWLKLSYDYKRHGKPSWKKLAEVVRPMDGAVYEKILEKCGDQS